MYIFIEALTGMTIRLKVSYQDTIENLKYRIEYVEGVPVSDQHLLYQNKELPDESTLEQLGITTTTTFKLVIGLRGGPISSPTKMANTIYLEVDDDDDCEISEESELSSRTNSALNSERPVMVIVLTDSGECQFLKVSSASQLDADADDTFLSWKDRISKKRLSEGSKSLKNKLDLLQLKMDHQKLTKRFSPKLNKHITSGNLERRCSLQERLSKTLPSSFDHEKEVIHTDKGFSFTMPLVMRKPSVFNRSLSLTGKMTHFNQTDAIMKEDIRSPLLFTGKTEISDRTPHLGIHRTNSDMDISGSYLNSYSHNSSKILTSSVSQSPSTIMEPIQKYTTNKKVLYKRPSMQLGHLESVNEDNENFSVDYKSKSVGNRITSAKDIKKSAQRCKICNKRLGLASAFDCRCGLMLCVSHRLPEQHNCAYDYKAAGKKLLSDSIPQISPVKLPKI